MKRLLFVLAFALGCVGAFATGPYNGTWNGGGSPTYVAAASGFGQCLSLAANGTVTMSPDASGSNPYTLSLRFNSSTSQENLMAGLSGAGGADGIALYGGNVYFSWNAYNNYITSGLTCDDGNWHTAEICGNPSTGDVYCFVDGVLVHHDTNLGATPNDKLVVIGNSSFTGLIDEVAWFNDTCLHTSNYTPRTTPWPNNTVGLDALYHFDGNLNDSTGSGPSAGTLTETAKSATTMTIATTAATGGTSPYTYQFQCSTSGSGPWTNFGSDTSSLTASLTGLTQNTTYYFQCVVTDSASNTVTSLGINATTLYTGEKPVLFIGDSITYGYNLTTPSTMSPPNETLLILQAAGVKQGFINNVAMVNGGVTGSTTANWQPGQTDYINAVASAQAAGCTVASIMLGTNDYLNSVTQATYLSNMSTIANDLITNQGFSTVVVNYIISFQASNPSLLVSYCTGLHTICNGTTIILGDTQANALFWANGQAYAAANALSYFGSDAEHPQSPQGTTTLGMLWANVLAPILGIPLGNGGTRIIGYAPNEDNLVYLFRELASAA